MNQKLTASNVMQGNNSLKKTINDNSNKMENSKMKTKIKKYHLHNSPSKTRQYFSDEVLLDSFQIFLHYSFENKYCAPNKFWQELNLYHSLPDINFQDYSAADSFALDCIANLGKAFATLGHCSELVLIFWRLRDELCGYPIASVHTQGCLEGFYRGGPLSAVGPIHTRISGYEPAFEDLKFDKLILENSTKFISVAPNKLKGVSQLVFWYNTDNSRLSVFEVDFNKDTGISGIDHWSLNSHNNNSTDLEDWERFASHEV
jgi:hypothetical protein